MNTSTAITIWDTPLCRGENGSQLRYFARWEDRILALLGFGAPLDPPGKPPPRDRFIGWPHRPELAVGTGEEPSTDRQQRPFLDPSLGPVQEPRLQAAGLGASRQLPQDWQDRSAYRPVSAGNLRRGRAPNASPAPATRLPTGSTSDRPKGAANWTVTTRPICPPKASGSTP